MSHTLKDHSTPYTEDALVLLVLLHTKDQMIMKGNCPPHVKIAKPHLLYYGVRFVNTFSRHTSLLGKMPAHEEGVMKITFILLDYQHSQLYSDRLNIFCCVVSHCFYMLPLHHLLFFDLIIDQIILKSTQIYIFIFLMQYYSSQHLLNQILYL